MKKIVLFLGVLISLGMFSACSNSDEINSSEENLFEALTPIEGGDGYTAIAGFFNSELRLGTEGLPECFFMGSQTNECYIINSKQELQELYSGKKDIPEIDFSKYTLIIGQEIMADYDNKIIRQELVCLDDCLLLNIFVPKKEISLCLIDHLFFWGLYPKVGVKRITVKINEI